MRTVFLLFPLLIAAACGRDECGGPPSTAEVPDGHPLLEPDAPEMREVPPDTFHVRLETTEGDVVVRIVRGWAPLGAQRFYNLVRHGFYDGSYFFRVLPGFAAQFGMSGRPAIDSVWNERPLPDDPPRVQNFGGTLAYATSGPDTRTTQLFFSYRLNEALDEQGFAPIGEVTEGMDVLYRLYSGYGDTPPQGSGPAFGCILSHGNRYLERRYPRLDRIDRATVLGPAHRGPRADG